MMRFAVHDVADDVALIWRPAARVAGAPCLMAHADFESYAAGEGLACGMWAFEALRIARSERRLGLDTDHRTIPNEASWIGTGVHLSKGRNRGHETVARVHTLGKPWRMTLLHLDGSDDRLPTCGAKLVLNGMTVGFLRTSARHHGLGPIVQPLVKRNVPLEAVLLAVGLAGRQEIIVDPEVGLQVRANLR